MNVTNFKTAAFGKLLLEVEAWENGQKRMHMGNQFDVNILESAIENFDSLSEDRWEWLANAEQVSVMTIAHAISTFEIEPLADGWTQ